MATISNESFKFMADLWENNNKPWFDLNRKRYDEHVAKPLKALAEGLAGPVGGILPEFPGKAKVSRINNDIRFAPNKPLYKEHMWVSFGSMGENSCADFFCGIGRPGWSCGAGIGSPKREGMEEWRKNLTNNSKLWLDYVAVLEEEEGKLHYYLGNPFAKPLYPDAPEALQPLLQAREAWLVTMPRTEFKDDPAREFFLNLCKVLPMYLFMMLPGALLKERLAELGSKIKAPDASVGSVWKSLRV